jgi:hypothetical protein
MICKVADCDNYVENPDLGLCASCAREARKVPKEKKRYEIPKISKKKSKALRKKNQAYEKMDRTVPRYCSGCGRADVPLSHSHLIPVSQRPDLEADLRNIVYDCLSIGGRTGCHDIWEHGSLADKMDLNNFQERVKILEELDPEYYHRVFTLKS